MGSLEEDMVIGAKLLFFIKKDNSHAIALMNYTIHFAALSVAFFLGFIMLYIWFVRKDDAYLFASLVSFTWAISSLNLVVHHPPMPTLYWESLVHSALSWMPLWMLFYIFCMTNQPKPTVKKILLGIFSLFTFTLLFVPSQYFFALANIWHLLSLFVGIYAVFLVIHSYIKDRERSMFILGLGFFTVALFAVHDYLVVMDILDPETRFLLDYAMPILLLTIVVNFIHLYVDARQKLERINTSLVKHVHDAEAEMMENFAMIAAMESEKAVAHERTRIFSDLHDDLGAKLLSLVYKSETDEQKKLAKQAMEGLREIVKQSTVVYPSPTNLIALWFSECQKRTSAHLIPFEWHQRRIPEAFVPPNALSYVLRQAVSDAMQGCDGERICVRLHIRFGLFIMSVSHTGQACLEKKGREKAEQNMLHHIQVLGGKIRWRNGKRGGCHVLWFIPLEKSICLPHASQ